MPGEIVAFQFRNLELADRAGAEVGDVEETIVDHMSAGQNPGMVRTQSENGLQVSDEALRQVIPLVGRIVRKIVEQSPVPDIGAGLLLEFGEKEVPQIREVLALRAPQIRQGRSVEGVSKESALRIEGGHFLLRNDAPIGDLEMNAGMKRNERLEHGGVPLWEKGRGTSPRPPRRKRSGEQIGQLCHFPRMNRRKHIHAFAEASPKIWYRFRFLVKTMTVSYGKIWGARWDLNPRGGNASAD